MAGLAMVSDKPPTMISPHVAQNIDRILQAVRSHLKMDVAFVSEFLGKNRIFCNVDSSSPQFPVKAGDVIPMAAGYCQHVVSGRLPELIPDTDAVAFAREIPETRSIPIGAHLSVPIDLDDGQVFGTFCCFSHVANLDLKKRDLEMLRTFGRIVASDIAVDLKADRERRAVIARIEAAMAAGDPHIVYQPIVRLTDMSMAGVECLSRFRQEPVQSPDKWFAGAHGVGMGVRLELVAVRKALEGAAALPATHMLGINISPQTLVGGGVAEALSGFDPKRLLIEITEHTPIEDYEPILRALAPLRKQGIRVAIDDAGAGYSSLRHILAMRPDVIKFDVSLTRGVDHDPVRKAMAAALVEFARHTGTEVVAEGVETQAEFDALRSLRFDKAQGYFLGRPGALPDILAASGSARRS